MSDDAPKERPRERRRSGRPIGSYRLSTLMEIREEMARVYRDMRAERIETNIGYRLTLTLEALGKATEQVLTAGLVDRLAQLEKPHEPDAESGAAPPTN